MTKSQIAAVLEEIATLLELKDENPFKIRAYANAARSLETFGGNISDLRDEEALAKIPGIGVRSISLADTVGIADAELIHRVVVTALKSSAGSEIGAHLHSTPAGAAAKILSAYDAGCRRFDSAIGGLGGCPFAQDTLVGNIPTESVVAALKERGVAQPLKIDNVLQLNARIAGGFA